LEHTTGFTIESKKSDPEYRRGGQKAGWKLLGLCETSGGFSKAMGISPDKVSHQISVPAGPNTKMDFRSQSRVCERRPERGHRLPRQSHSLFPGWSSPDLLLGS